MGLPNLNFRNTSKVLLAIICYRRDNQRSKNKCLIPQKVGLFWSRMLQKNWVKSSSMKSVLMHKNRYSFVHGLGCVVRTCKDIGGRCQTEFCRLRPWDLIACLRITVWRGPGLSLVRFRGQRPWGPTGTWRGPTTWSPGGWGSGSEWGMLKVIGGRSFTLSSRKCVEGRSLGSSWWP